MGQAVQLAPAGNEAHYERRRPEETTLYQVVQEHLETFLAQVEAETGASLPEFVKDEFDAFLECGILAHGFLRLRCARVARMRSWWPFPASGAGFAPPAGRGAWRKPPPTWSTTSSRACRCANGCCRFRSHCASCSPPIPICSRRCCRCIHRVIAAFLIKQAGLKRSRSRHRRGHAHPALRLRGQSEHPSALPGARRRLSKPRGRAGLP